MEALHTKLCDVGMYAFHGVPFEEPGEMFPAGEGVFGNVINRKLRIGKMLLYVGYGLLDNLVSGQFRSMLFMKAFCHIYEKSAEHIAAQYGLTVRISDISAQVHLLEK